MKNKGIYILPFISNPYTKIFNLIRSERFRRLSKEGSWIVVGQILIVLGYLVGVRLLTELMSPVVYGELTLGVTVATLVGQIIVGPLGNGLTRFYAPSVEKNDFGGYMKSAFQLVLWATILILIIAFTASSILAFTAVKKFIPFLIVAVLYSILSNYNSMLNGLMNAARKRSIAAIHQGTEPWSRFLIAAGLMALFGQFSTIALIGYCLGTAIILTSQLFFFRGVIPDYQGGDSTKLLWRKKILDFSWPFALWGIFTWGQLVSDRWSLELFATSRDVGLFAILYQLGYVPMSMATGLGIQFLMPIFYQKAGDASDINRVNEVKNLSYKLTKLALGMTSTAFFIGLLFHHQIFTLLVNKRFVSISYLLPWMLIAGGFFAAGQTITLNLLSQLKSALLVKVKIITAIIGIVFNIIGAYFFGITGVVIAIVLFSIIYFVWTVLISESISKTR